MVDQVYFKHKLTEKEIKFEAGRKRKLDESGQKIQTSCYKLSTRDIMHKVINLMSTARHIKVTKRNSKSVHHKEFFFISFASM